MQKETKHKEIKRRASELEYRNSRADADAREEAVSRALDFVIALAERGKPGLAIELISFLEGALNNKRAKQ
ncbi:hypothetical protein [Hyphococcus luteus]|jgi:hypothetical protein|uniref:Uncharacterized protein n=1 Tax=Hyphococcus luteus TaxID=2058213 RepID=A0A2S7K1L1_9PROT|nr:hypothetical protein [Marinicaulis flavus]PQA86318.1 hypothetical protein CW354_18420 [Marinicaulis flavus]